MKNLLLAIVVTVMGFGLANTAKADGPHLLCVSTDHQAFARIRPQVGSVDVDKAAPTLPAYTFSSCIQQPAPDQQLSCTGAGNRTFILYTNLTGRYIGSHETRDFTCQYAGGGAD